MHLRLLRWVSVNVKHRIKNRTASEQLVYEPGNKILITHLQGQRRYLYQDVMPSTLDLGGNSRRRQRLAVCMFFLFVNLAQKSIWNSWRDASVCFLRENASHAQGSAATVAGNNTKAW